MKREPCNQHLKENAGANGIDSLVTSKPVESVGNSDTVSTDLLKAAKASCRPAVIHRRLQKAEVSLSTSFPGSRLLKRDNRPFF